MSRAGILIAPTTEAGKTARVTGADLRFYFYEFYFLRSQHNSDLTNKQCEKTPNDRKKRAGTSAIRATGVARQLRRGKIFRAEGAKLF